MYMCVPIYTACVFLMYTHVLKLQVGSVMNIVIIYRFSVHNTHT